jgi:hypothetical protein
VIRNLPDLRAGVYRHFRGPLYLVLGYGHDANADGRQVVVYIGLQLDGAKAGPRLAVRDVDDFLAIVDPATGETRDFPYPSPDYPRRFTYIGPAWEGERPILNVNEAGAPE